MLQQEKDLVLLAKLLTLGYIEYKSRLKIGKGGSGLTLPPILFLESEKKTLVRIGEAKKRGFFYYLDSAKRPKKRLFLSTLLN